MGVFDNDNTQVQHKPLVPIKELKKVPKGFMQTADGTLIKIPAQQSVGPAPVKTRFAKEIDKRRGEIQQWKEEEQKKKQEQAETIEGVIKMTLPSTYIGPLFNNNGKSYTDNLLSGEGTGDWESNLAIDLITPFAANKAINIARKIPYRLRVPISSSKYYRVLSDLSQDKASEALNDIVTTGMVRANPRGTLAGSKRERYIGPYFTRGKLYNPKAEKDAKVIIVSKGSPDLDWLPIKPHQSELIIDPSNLQFTPLINGVPNQTPSKYFDFYKRGDNFVTKHLWKKVNIKNSAPEPKLFTYPENSGVLVHMDYGDYKGAFSNNGAFIQDGFLYPGHAKNVNQQPYTWLNLNKPYSLSNNGNEFTRAIVVNRDNVPGLIRVRDSSTPIGQWGGNSGFVLKSEYVTSQPINMKKALIFEYNPQIKRFKLRLNK